MSFPEPLRLLPRGFLRLRRLAFFLVPRRLQLDAFAFFRKHRAFLLDGVLSHLQRLERRLVRFELRVEHLARLLHGDGLLLDLRAHRLEVLLLRLERFAFRRVRATRLR